MENIHAAITAILVVFTTIIIGIMVYGTIANNTSPTISTYTEKITHSGRAWNATTSAYHWYNWSTTYKLDPNSNISATLYNSSLVGSGLLAYRVIDVPQGNITVMTSPTANGSAYKVLRFKDQTKTATGFLDYPQLNITYQTEGGYLANKVTTTSNTIFSLAPIIGLLLICILLVAIVTKFGVGGSGL